MSTQAVGPLTTKEDWRAFVEYEVPPPPARLSARQYRQLPDAERERFDTARLQHHRNFGPLLTPAMQDIHIRLGRLLKSNDSASPLARPGAVIDGASALGKTTIGTQFGRRYEVEARARNSERVSADDFIPVAYITVPSGATIKGLNESILDYFGQPQSRTTTRDHMTRTILKIARRCATRLFIIDDIHFLFVRSQPAALDVNNHLKYLANTVAATFVYLGIDCETKGLFDEGGIGEAAIRSQTRRRFRRLPIEPYAIDSPRHRETWLSLLYTLERQLRLLKLKDGELGDKWGEYLYYRTGGVMGSLMTLIRQAANLAIEDGRERLSESLLDEIELDYAAEEQARLRRPTSKRSAGGS